MRKLGFLLILSVLAIGEVAGQFVSNPVVGNYEDASSWVGDPPPANGSTSQPMTIVSGAVITRTGDFNPARVTINGRFIVNNGNCILAQWGSHVIENGAYVEIFGNLTASQSLDVKEGATLIVHGNVNVTNAGISINGNMVVKGDFTITNGNVSNTGKLVIGGTFKFPGGGFSSPNGNSNLYLLDPDADHEYAYSPIESKYGDLEDFLENESDNEDLMDIVKEVMPDFFGPPAPTATITSGPATICMGDSYDLVITLTGNSPWEIQYSDGTTTSGWITVNTSPHTIPLEPAGTTTYTLIAVRSGSITGNISGGLVTVTVNPLPPLVSLSGDDPDNIICTGLEVVFTASPSEPPFSTYDFQINGVSVQNNASHTYSASSLSNGDIVSVIASTVEGCGTTSNQITMTVADRVWTGVTNTDWSVSTNWCGGIPGQSDDIIIPNGIVNMPDINNAGAEIRNIVIQDAAMLTIAGANNIDVYGNWTNDGSFVPNSGSVTFRGTGTVSGNATHTFNDITIMGANTLTASSGTMNIMGNLNNSGTFNHNNGTIVLNGTAAQTITGVGNMYNLQINNAAGVVFTNNVVVANGLTLTDGKVNTSGNTFHLLAGATVNPAAGQSNSYIIGRFIKSNVSASFTFPIGSAARWRPAFVNNVSSPGSDWEAEYFEGPATNDALVANLTPSDPLILTMSTVEYWKISDGSVSPSGITANVGLSWGMESAVSSEQSDREMLQVMSWNPANSNWDNFGGGSFSAGHSQAQGSFSSTSLVSFSEKIFTLASSVTNNPLPVELISFTGEEKDGVVLLNWRTASEQNNDYFLIEHSPDAKSFIAIGEVAGAGTVSTTQNYAFTHRNPAYPGNYYRLKQVDFDGAFEYSDVILVRMNGIYEREALDFDMYPNPATGNTVSIKFNAVDYSQSLTIEMVSLNGRLLYQQVVEPADFIDEISLDFGNNLSRGVYIVRLVQSGNSGIRKLVLK